MTAHALTITGRAVGRWRLKAGLFLLRFAFWLMRGFRMEVEINGKRTQTYCVYSTVTVTAEVRDLPDGYPS